MRRLAVGKLTPRGTRMLVPHDRIPEVALTATVFRAQGYEVSIFGNPAILDGRAPDTGAVIRLRRKAS